MTILFNHTNEIAERLDEALGDWYVEAEGETVGRAYNLDVREDPPQEDVVSVEIRTDFKPPFSVSTTVWFEKKGTADRQDSSGCETLSEAVSEAERLAAKAEKSR